MHVKWTLGIRLSNHVHIYLITLSGNVSDTIKIQLFTTSLLRRLSVSNYIHNNLWFSEIISTFLDCSTMQLNCYNLCLKIAVLLVFINDPGGKTHICRNAKPLIIISTIAYFLRSYERFREYYIKCCQKIDVNNVKVGSKVDQKQRTQRALVQDTAFLKPDLSFKW